MKRLSIAGLGVALVVLALSGRSEGIAQAQGLTLAIDADITNGTRPCDPIDDTATVQVFNQHTVGVCLEGHQGSPDSFELEMTYSEEVSLNEGVVDPGTPPFYLDANPDANDGAGPNGIGTAGWTCDPVPGVYTLPTMGPPAYIVCATLDPSGPELTADPGLLATFTFTATAVGTDTLSLTTRSNVFGNNCQPQGTMVCEGAVTHKIGCPDDVDCDGVLDEVDNCPTTPNPGQENADAAIDNGPALAGDDATVPKGDPADTEGDACETDGDIDNDGLPDAEDTNPLSDTGICAAFAGTNDLHPNPAGGDITNDDDGNGDPAPPMGSDAADNGPSWDTDNDGVLDGAECILGYNPRHPGSNPTTEECGGTGDSDGDGLLDAWETCGWGSYTRPYDGDPVDLGEAADGVDPTDSDGDGLGDCLEATDVTGNGTLNYTGDVMAYAKAVLWDPGQFGQTMDFDLTKNGILNFTGDVMEAARRILGVVACSVKGSPACSTGESYPHGSSWALSASKAYISTKTNPYKLLRLNPADLTYSTYTADVNENQSQGITYVGGSVDKVFVARILAGSSDTYIDRFDPNDSPPSREAVYSYAGKGHAISIDNDGANLYVGTINGWVLRIQISDMTLADSRQVESGAIVHAIRYDSQNGYVFATTTSTGNIYRLNASDFGDSSVYSSAWTGSGCLTDDFAVVTDYIFVGKEGGLGRVIKVSKSDLSNQTYIDCGPSGTHCWGVWEDTEDSGYVWAVFSGTDGTVSRIKVSDSTYVRLWTGKAATNEIVQYGADSFLITTYTSPSALCRITDPFP